MNEPVYVYVRHGGVITPIPISELLTMVDAARELADAALVRRVPEAVRDGEQVFAFALRPGPLQGKAIVSACLLRELMDRIESGKRARDVVTTATQVATDKPANDAPPPATSSNSSASSSSGSKRCPGNHPDDMACELCEDEWGAREDAKRAARAAEAQKGAA